jgi:ribosomal protein L7/L12
MPGVEPVGALSGSLLLGALILKLTDLVKHVREAFRGDPNGLITLLLTWVVGFIAVQVTIEWTQWGDEINIGQQTLDQLDTGSKIVLGLIAPAVGAVLYDAKKAIDNTDTASTPRMTDDAETVRKAMLNASMTPPPPGEDA